MTCFSEQVHVTGPFRTPQLRAMSSERSFQVSWGSGMLPSFLSGRERRFGEGLR